MTPLPILLPDEVRPFVIGSIQSELLRQSRLKAQGKFNHTPDEVPPSRAYLMLQEECGEVSKAILELSGDVQEKDTTTRDLYNELIHVAAVAAAMAEGILKGVRVA